MAKTDKNFERLKIARELLKRKKPPTISAPDLLSGIEKRQRKLRSADIKKGPMYPMDFNDISAAVRKQAKQSVLLKGKKGTIVKCPTKLGERNKPTKIY